MKPILKSANQKKRSDKKIRKSEFFFEVKPYTQAVIFSDKKSGDNVDYSIYFYFGFLNHENR